ncbi:hypothetical protein [Enterococcus hirae]|uniref:Uncharacterized protein n=1 Tax=Enterococcus hirae TaxID=1354 RepID=A0A7Z9AYH7_ENTHR|nr:hypothetical protein [Enterococcus hirae]VTQ74387.1 Uncharacterised protein [Enterococcus hirae]
MNQYNKIKKSLLIGATILGITANSSVILATTNSGSSAGSLEKGVTLNSNQLKQARKLTQKQQYQEARR